MSTGDAGHAGRKAAAERELDAARRRTFQLLAPLDDDDVHRQHDAIMSPLVWDLGHIGNYEELWLVRALGGSRIGGDDLDAVYNPFENPRWVRGDLPFLSRGEAEEYLADVRAAALRRLRATELDADAPLLADAFVYSLVAQHEVQHQETMLQTLDLRPDASPYHPAAAPLVPRPRPVDDAERVVVPAGRCTVGTADRCAYDNERPVHTLELAAFAIDRFPVTARRYAAFVDDGGYDRDDVWSERGWAWRCETGHRAPQGWLRGRDGQWLVRRFHHVRSLDPREPVQHVSFFEADAFARWAGGRLPTEFEWEKAATWDPAAQRARRYPWGDAAPTPRRTNVGGGRYGPAPVGSYPAGASAYGVEQLVGDCYEWTASPFEPYPGYTTFPYPEYSEVFFGGDYRVLRGASWASSPLVARATFRNWDHPYRRQLFAGFRLAWSVR